MTMMHPDMMNWLLCLIRAWRGVERAMPTVKAPWTMMAKMYGLTSILEAAKMSRE